MSSGHQHNSNGGSHTQNQGNTLGNRACIRQSKLFRQYESGNTMKDMLGCGSNNLNWNINKTEGVYKDRNVYDHNAQPMNSGFSIKNEKNEIEVRNEVRSVAIDRINNASKYQSTGTGNSNQSIPSYRGEINNNGSNNNNNNNSGANNSNYSNNNNSNNRNINDNSGHHNTTHYNNPNSNTNSNANKQIINNNIAINKYINSNNNSNNTSGHNGNRHNGNTNNANSSGSGTGSNRVRRIQNETYNIISHQHT